MPSLDSLENVQPSAGAVARKCLLHYAVCYERRTGKPCLATKSSAFWKQYMPLYKTIIAKYSIGEEEMCAAISLMFVKSQKIPAPGLVAAFVKNMYKKGKEEYNVSARRSSV